MTTYVIYARDTGHVLGALSVTGGAGTAPAVGDLVGEGISLRVARSDGRPATVTVPADRLATMPVDDSPAVYGNPLAYAVPATGGTVLRQLTGALSSVALSSGAVTVTLPASGQPAAGAALVFVSDQPPLAQNVDAGATSVTVATTLPAGEAGVLTLVSGWIGRLEGLTVASAPAPAGGRAARAGSAGGDA